MRSLILQAILIVFFLAQQVISFTPLFVLSTSSTQGSSQRLFSVPSLSRWHEFDYTQQWYPVSWVSDLPRSQPHQVSLLDQTYAVVMDGTSFVTAYVDQCPHRAAVLSEGRYVKSTRRLQCAYHGWSFDANGTCVDIPQNNKLYSTNTRATTVPAIVHQGLVWLWPEAGGFPNKDPPTITELNDPAFKVVTAVRDFPVVDWTLLISNILDPVSQFMCVCWS
jgi:phenylpropionate dioxygenase-like ring-hydroxylating dioxygenase large terminal subunit